MQRRCTNINAKFYKRHVPAMVLHRRQCEILTPLHVLFLNCLYISSRALSKVFEHRNFVARYQRETNHITVAGVAPW